MSPKPWALGLIHICTMLAAMTYLAETTPAAEPEAVGSCQLTIGAQTHFGQGWPIGNMRLAAKLGISQIRDAISWERSETSPAAYDLHRPDTAFLPRAAALGLGVTLVFATGNDLYDEGMTPYSDAGRKAFAQFVAAVVDEYGATIRAIEVGNEFNGSFVTGPAKDDRVAKYTALLREVHAAVKARRPDMIILGGAAHSVPIGWFRQLGEVGAFDYMDGVAIHPYRAAPEHLDREIGRLQALIAEFGPPKPIFATEFGLETDDASQSPDYLVKMAALMSVAGVCDASWYALREQKWFRNMGLFDLEGGEMPAARAFDMVTTEMTPQGRARRLSIDPLAHVYQFGDAGPIVAWGAGQSIRLGAAATAARRSDGEVIPPPLRLDGRPIIVTGGGIEIGETDTVADTLYQYGEAPWSYFLSSAGTGERVLGWRDWQWTSYLGDAAFPALAVRQGGVSPAGHAPDMVSVIERFTAPESGSFLISGWWSKQEAASGDGVRLEIARNGKAIWSHDLRDAERFDLAPLAVEMSAGETLDFTVAPGATSQGDATQRRIVIARGSAGTE